LPFQSDEEDEKIEYKDFFIGVPGMFEYSSIFRV